MNDALNALSNIGPRLVVMLIIVVAVKWVTNRMKSNDPAAPADQLTKEAGVILQNGKLPKVMGVFAVCLGALVWLCLPFADPENVSPILWLGALFASLGALIVLMTFWYSVRYDAQGFEVRYGYSPRRKVAWSEVIGLEFGEVSKNYEVITTQTKSKVKVSSMLQNAHAFEMRCQLVIGMKTLTQERFWSLIGEINKPATSNPKHRAARLSDGLHGLDSGREQFAFQYRFVTAMNALSSGSELTQQLFAVQASTANLDAEAPAKHLKANIVACGQVIFSEIAMNPAALQAHISSCDDWLNRELLDALPTYEISELDLGIVC